MKRVISCVLLMLVLTSNAFALEVPTDTVVQNLNGSQQAIKTFTVSPEQDPAALIEEPFELEGYLYTFADIVKSENPVEEKRIHNIACSRLIGRFRRVGSNSLILRGHQRLTHKIGAGDLPLHIGKAQGSAVLDGCRGDIGHIVAVKLSDGFGFRHRVVFRSIAGGYGIETGVIQCEGTLKSAVIILDGGLKLLQNQSKVIFRCFNGDNLGRQMCIMLGGISMKTAYKLLGNGEIHHLKIGKSFKIPKICVIEYLLG